MSGQPAGEGMADAIRRVLDDLNPIDFDHDSDRQRFQGIRLRVMAIANEADKLIAERDALINLHATAVAGGQWLALDRDRLAARCEGLERLLRSARMHVANDCEWSLLSDIDAALSPPANSKEST